MVFLGDCQQVMAYIEEVLRVTVALPEDDEERKESLSLLFGAAEMVSKTQRGHFANHVAQFVPPIVSVLTSQLQVQVRHPVCACICCCGQLLGHEKSHEYPYLIMHKLCTNEPLPVLYSVVLFFAGL